MNDHYRQGLAQEDYLAALAGARRSDFDRVVREVTREQLA
jgi:hypothetical protein